MRVLSLSLDRALGSTLAHNVTQSDGRRVLRKGARLGEAEVERLRAVGRSTVYVVELEAGDVGEDEAARALGEAVAGDGVRISRARTGRTNLSSAVAGVLRLDVGRLLELNRIAGVALATLREHAAVVAGTTLATLKIVPYALSADEMSAALEATRSGALLAVTELRRRQVGIVLSGSPGAAEGLLPDFAKALTRRVEALGSTIDQTEYVVCEAADREEAELGAAIAAVAERGAEAILLAGETAIVDAGDLAPRAIERAGGEVVAYGAPVDPGNLVLLAYRGEVPIVGMPGCARSPKPNVVDLILPRLLAGDRLDGATLAALGHGGLLEDVPERGLPRSWLV